jgi:hypothetical protein
MWRLDLRQLLQQPDPRLDMMVVREASKRSAQELIDLWQAQDGAAARPTCPSSAAAKQRHTGEYQSRPQSGKTFGTVSLHTLASTVERGAWRNVDPTAPSPRNSQCKGQHSSAPVNGETAAHWGHWHRNRDTGETATSIIGKLLASIYGIQYGALFETRHHAVAARAGVKERPGECLRKYCQFGGVWQGTCSLRKM